MLVDEIVSIQVGWALPSEESLRFNFHVSIHGVEWNEVHDYTGMISYLDESIRTNCETLAHIRLPVIDRDTNVLIENILTPRVAKYNIENLKILDKHSVAIENWINDLMNQITNMDEESSKIIRQMFFKSTEKLNLFNLFYQTVKKSIEVSETTADKKAPKSMLTKVGSKLFKRRKDKPVVVGLSERNLNNFSGGGKSGGSSLPDRTTHDIASVTDASERADIKSFTLGNFVRKVGGTRSLTDNRNPEAEDDVLDSKNSSVMRVEVQRGQTINGRVLVYDIILRIVSKKYPTPVVYSTFQRYNSFKALNEKLIEANKAVSNTVYKNAKVINNAKMEDFEGRETTSHADFINLIQTPFPVVRNLKTLLGMSLNDSDLSVRYYRCVISNAIFNLMLQNS